MPKATEKSGQKGVQPPDPLLSSPPKKCNKPFANPSPPRIFRDCSPPDIGAEEEVDGIYLDEGSFEDENSMIYEREIIKDYLSPVSKSSPIPPEKVRRGDSPLDSQIPHKRVRREVSPPLFDPPKQIFLPQRRESKKKPENSTPLTAGQQFAQLCVGGMEEETKNEALRDFGDLGLKATPVPIMDPTMITKLNWERYEASTSKLSTKELKTNDFTHKGLHTDVKYRQLYYRLAQNNGPLIKASDLLTQEDINIDELQDLVSLSIELNTDLMAEINQKRRDNVIDNHRGLNKGLE